jgi:AraC-like DNA-binding protein
MGTCPAKAQVGRRLAAVVTVPEPRLTIRAIRPLASGLRALGHDPAPVLAAAGIDTPLLDDPDATVPMGAGVAFLAEAARRAGDPNIGLHLAERADLGSFDVHLYAMLSSPTLGAAFERLGRYQRLIHETTRVELAREGACAVLRHRMPGGLAAPRQTAEFLVAAWLRGGRVATGEDWGPLEVRFAHRRPDDVREHAQVFRAPVHFSAGENALVLPATLLDRPCVRADPALLAVLDRYAADRIARTPATSSFADRARAGLVELLRDGNPGASRLAARLRMSVRSLARGLAAEGTSYRELLDHLRRETAAHHLADDRVAIAEVAFLLGFADLSAFYRAFKRWTGKTPAEFRRDPG